MQAALAGLAWDDHVQQIAVLRALIERPDPGGNDGDVLRCDLWEELHQHLRALERYDEAIEAKRNAVAAGYRSTPDPEADIAEIYVAQGRLDEAAALYGELVERDPDDVWLYKSAAWAYRAVDPQLALDWARDGIAMAIDTGDPDRLATQLLGFAREAQAALGLPPDDDLEAAVASLDEAWVPPATEADGYTTIDPTHVSRTAADLLRGLRGDPGRTTVMSFFPADEWARAIEQWPELFVGTSSHDDYRRRIESKAKTMNKLAPGQVRHIAVLTVDDVIALAAERGLEHDWFEARSALADVHLRNGATLAYPPKRNDRCWCGSGQKYKRCCEPVPVAPIET